MKYNDSFIRSINLSKEIIIFYSIFIFRQMIIYKKKKVDDDINGNLSLEDTNYFSRPEMVMIGENYFILGAIELFFIKYFGVNMEFF